MRRALRPLEVGFYLAFVLAFAGILAYCLGIQPLIGQANQMNIWICVSLACGSMLMMALYNTALRLFTKSEKAALYFSLFCVGQSSRFFFMEGSIGDHLFPNLPPLLVDFGLRYFMYALAISGLVFFVYEIFGAGRSQKLKYVLVASIWAVCMTTPIFGIENTLWRPIVFFPEGIFVNMTLAVVILKSPEYKTNRLSRLYLAGFIMYFVSFFFTATAIDAAPFIAVMFNFIFAVIHAVLLSDRFAKALKAVEEANAALEEKVAERTAELAKSERGVREMVRNISHDLRTPMSVMSGNLQMLEGDRPGSEDFSRHLGVIKTKMNDMTRLARNLSAVSRLEAGEAIYRMERATLSAVMNELYQRYENIAEQSGVSLRANFAQDCAVTIDMSEIWSVFENILNNALRYTPRGGVIRVEANGPENGFVTISVSDTGPGVAAEHLPKLFEQYYMADAARTDGKGGSGIGLYIVKTAVEAMGGFVTVSCPPGEGLTVSFTLKCEE